MTTTTMTITATTPKPPQITAGERPRLPGAAGAGRPGCAACVCRRPAGRWSCPSGHPDAGQVGAALGAELGVAGVVATLGTVHSRASSASWVVLDGPKQRARTAARPLAPSASPASILPLQVVERSRARVVGRPRRASPRCAAAGCTWRRGRCGRGAGLDLAGVGGHGEVGDGGVLGLAGAVRARPRCSRRAWPSRWRPASRSGCRSG